MHAKYRIHGSDIRIGRLLRLNVDFFQRLQAHQSVRWQVVQLTGGDTLYDDGLLLQSSTPSWRCLWQSELRSPFSSNGIFENGR
jgi:hypothetical protein